MIIMNARAWMDGRFRTGVQVRMTENRVSETGEGLTALPGEQILDLEGDYLLPGFVDVHIHGYQGEDAMRGEEAVRRMSRGLYRLGVAAFCPTTMSAGPEETRRAAEGIRAVRTRPEPWGARVLGAHLEAPFLNPDKAGAQRKECFRNPDWACLEEMTGGTEIVRLITLAPELPGSEALIRRAAAAGIHISVGHSAADAETVHRAAEWGADHVTHTFNAQSPLNHRAPGVPGAALTDDRLVCELICDGVHLHPDIIRLALRCKGADRIAAITDAMEAAGMPDGSYSLGGQKVLVKQGEARLEDGTLAGSVLTMPQAMENLIHRWHIAPEEACVMCTSAPAASVGEEKAGRILPGSPAPLTRWSGDWRMKGILPEIRT